MLRFYGFLQKKTVRGNEGFTGGFAISTVFLEVKTCEVVVKCVVKRGGWDGTFRMLKIFQLAQLYFLWRIVRS
jgi:hypothetical protein